MTTILGIILLLPAVLLFGSILIWGDKPGRPDPNGPVAKPAKLFPWLNM